MTTWPTKPFRRGIRRQVIDTSDPTLVGAWDGKIVAGVVPDESGNGNDGVPRGITTSRTSLGDATTFIEGRGDAETCGGADAFPLTNVTVACWVYLLGQASATRIFNYYKDSSDSWGIYLDNADNIFIYDDIDNAGASLYTTGYTPGKWHHVVAVMDALENKLYLDGELVGSGTSSSAAWSSMAATAYWGIRDTSITNNCLNGMLTDKRIYNEAKDLAWVQADYALGAPAVQFGTDWGVHESLAGETAGYLGQGSSPFEISSGTWKISTDTINGQLCKVIECVASGLCYVPASLFLASPTEASYGSWQWWLYKGAEGTFPKIGFVAQSTVAIDAVGSYGYSLEIDAAETYRLRRRDNGVATNLIATGTAPLLTWIRIDVTRDYAGGFNLYSDGVQIGTEQVDTTYTTASYVVLDLDTADKIAYADLQGGHSILKLLGVSAP